MRKRPDPVLLELFAAPARLVPHAAALLRDLLAEFPDDRGRAEEIHACEHEGDRISHEILRRLAERGAKRSHMDAADVHALAHALDDVVDFAEEAADQLGRYGVEAPMAQAEEIAGVLVTATGEVANGMHLGPRLVEIHRLENEADQIVRGAVAQLFAQGIDPMIVIRWKDIFESLESSVDACETVANVLEGISLKRRS